MTVLKGKVAIVTGASSGIGEAVARLFAAEGASVVLTARRGALLREIVAEIEGDGGQAVAVPGDITDEALIGELVEVANKRFGGLDIAFNNAAIMNDAAPLPEIAPTAWRETIEVNLTAPFLCARQQIPAMLARGGGSLIFTGSFVGHTVGFPGMAAYAASKAGLVGLMQVIAAEFGAQGIRANAVLPGATYTPMAREVASTPELRDFIRVLYALKRIAEPEEIARTVLHLASDAAGFVTGAAWLVDGGVSINRT